MTPPTRRFRKLAPALLALLVAPGMLPPVGALPSSTGTYQWTGTTHIDERSFFEHNSYGHPPPERQASCDIRPTSPCARLEAGWIKYELLLVGVEGKGVDTVVISTNVAHPGWARWCAVSLNNPGASHPDAGEKYGSTAGQCPLGLSVSSNFYVTATRVPPGSHDLFVYCIPMDTWCGDTYVDSISYRAYYNALTAEMGDPRKVPASPTDPIGKTCIRFTATGSYWHGDLEMAIDWGLGPGAYETFPVRLDASNRWSEERCKALPPSLIPYQVCMEAREIDGLRRQIGQCRDVLPSFP